MSRARALVEQASAILLDFDGPVCSVFAGRPAAQVAAEMRLRLTALDPSAALPTGSQDPLEVLRLAWEHPDESGSAAEALLSAAELDAVSVCTPTDGAQQFLESMQRQGTLVAIVSNNSERAIHAYLERRALTSLVAVVSARDPRDAGLMKPHPRSLDIAVSRLRSRHATSLMVGDSETDVVAARTSGVRVIAYANKGHKSSLFTALGADAIVTSMHELAG